MIVRGLARMAFVRRSLPQFAYGGFCCRATLWRQTLAVLRWVNAIGSRRGIEVTASWVNLASATAISLQAPQAIRQQVTKVVGAEVFDVYSREGETSLALRLEFRASDRTLTDEEIAPIREKIIAGVAEKLEGRLRA